MAAWTVMWRGIRFRAGRSVLILLLAMTSTAAGVVAVGYLRAARQSVLTDALAGAPAYATDVVIAAAGPAGPGDSAVPTPGAANSAVRAALAGSPRLAAQLGHPVAGIDTDTLVRTAGAAAMARLAYRDQVCAHVTVDGRCPAAPGEVMVSRRSADADHVRVGDPLTVQFAVDAAGHGGRTLPVKVVGLYTPVDPAAAYWGTGAYFADGPDPTGPVPDRLDAVFTATQSDVRTDPTAAVALHVAIPLRARSIGVDDIAQVRRDLVTFTADVGAGADAGDLTVTSGLPQVLDGIAAAQGSLGRTVPAVAVPLVLLCLFVLFLVVAALAEERGPELALAKLRGFPAGRATRFGMAEVLALIVLAGPLGLLVGLGLVEIAARGLLATGTHAALSWPVAGVTLLAILIGAGAAGLAARGTLRRPVLSLLRRVPGRDRWSTTAGEVAVAVAALATLIAALQDRSSALGLLAAPMIALLGGVAAARLLGLTAGWRLRRSSQRGAIAGLLTGAHLARQAGRRRVIVVLTVAVALLVFGATAWDAGAQARRQAAGDTLGAERVYSVQAAYPSALVAAVGLADPSGDSMAVVRADEHYAGGDVSLLGVESVLLPKIALWRGAPPGGLVALESELRPAAAPEIVTDGELTVSYDVVSVTGRGVSMSVLLSGAGQPPVTAALDNLLAVGPRSDTVHVTGCAAGCRVLGFRFSPTDPGTGHVSASIRLTSVRGAGATVGDFSDPTRWRADTSDAPDATLAVEAGPALGIQLESGELNGVLVAYRDTPDRLPAVLAGPAPADNRAATSFDFPGIGGDAQPFEVVARADRLPRVGTRGLLFDLGDAVGMAERDGSLADAANLQYEVWANADAPADLATRLAAHGIPVRATDTVAADLDRLSRGAPTLGLWLYLFAGALALLLAAGTVLLGTYIGADIRVYEFAALKVSGVRPHVLRRAILGEYLDTLGVALLVGVLAGLLGAALMLPGLPLVSVAGPPARFPGSLVVLPWALVASVLAMSVVVALALRVVGRATPERLREGAP